MNNVPAVVTPLDDHMGLDIARSLGCRSIPVYGIDPNPNAAGRTSKYCRFVECPDPQVSEQEYVQFLMDWGKEQENKPVLFPVSDETVQICSRERTKLLPYFQFVMPDQRMMFKLASKQGLAEVAEEFHVLAPKTIVLRDRHEIEEIAPQLIFPVILKPVESSSWHTPEIAAALREDTLGGRAKVVVCHDIEELLKVYQRIAAYDDRLIIQEIIPGPDENLTYISFYLNRQSRPLAIFAGRKLRVLPVGFGSASYVRSFQDPELEQIAMQFLMNVQYQGLGGLEFKKDVRDGRYKLIEFNTRFGMWDGLGVFCGVDTPYIAYQDTLSRQVEPQLTYRENVIWVDLQRDFRAIRIYHQRGDLTLKEWLHSLRGEKMWAVYSRDDWRPGVKWTLGLLKLLWTRLAGKERYQA